MPSRTKAHLTRSNNSHGYQLLSQSKAHTAEDDHEVLPSPPPPLDSLREAIFAGGSFCQLEARFGLADGVLGTATGYCGGTLPKPSYRQVCQGSTGHTEAVRVVYDARRISYKSLCGIFWRSHDSTNRDLLGFGAGTHLRSAIFYGDEGERRAAVETKVERQMRLQRRIVTRIVPRGQVGFQVAEADRQKGGLQRNFPRVCDCLHLRSTEQLVESQLACKLNGILCSGMEQDETYQNLERFVESHSLPMEVLLALKETMQEIKKPEIADSNRH